MRIIEIFKSIQGEGRNQGLPCVFIRLAGCNLNCLWCDTPHARDMEAGEEMSLVEAISVTSMLGGKYVCITGGEPMMQAESVIELAKALHEKGFCIDIETNGSIDFRGVQKYASICMDVKCPSSGEAGASDISLIPDLTEKDAIKFVVGDENDCRYAESVLDRTNPECPVFFSPVEGSNISNIASYMLEKNLRVRLQLQLHKIIGVR